VALSFNIVSLFAGGLLSLFSPLFSEAPWILALFPPILTIRGDISGIFSGNLTTMLHIGSVQPKIRGNTEAYRRLVGAIFVLTLIDALAMGAISFILNLLLGKATPGQLYIFTCVPSVSCMIAVTVSIPLTSLIAIISYRRGLNPDILVYPILASVNDIVVTASFVAVTSLVLIGGLYVFLLGSAFVAIICICIILARQNSSHDLFKKTIREGTALVILSSLFGSVNGIFLSNLTEIFQTRPGLITLYPALTNMLGNIGSITGSITTTNLALGYVESFKEEIQQGVKRILRIETIAVFMHAVAGTVAYLMNFPFGASLSFLVSAALITNLSSFFFISMLALVVAFLAFNRGLNPDNVVIPFITSMSDTVATLSMLVTTILLKLVNIL
jgi:mgtE-like transporter